MSEPLKADDAKPFMLGPSLQGMTYKKLSQRHPSYDRKRIDLVNALYEGGFAVTDHPDRVLEPQVGENAERFK